MNRHPGGIEHTKRMLTLSGLAPPAKILDMGAGMGEAVACFRSLGYKAVGIDLKMSTPPVKQAYAFCKETAFNPHTNILQADFLHPPFEKESFDGIISQCAFYVSGQPEKALSVAYRLLKPGGILMLSDAVLRDTSLKHQAQHSGFTVLHFEDQTPAWKEYYIEAIWRGTADCFPCNQKMNYEMIICKK